MLLGANVINKGTISTPDGRTILAAGLQVGLDSHNSNDPSLRGWDVYVGAIADASGNAYAGTATDEGLIQSPRGNVVIAGRNVNQFGGIDSSTSVSLNGRIDLLADYDAISSGGVQNVPPFLPKSAGTITLGAGSVTRILPEWDSTESVMGTQWIFAVPSLMNIR